MKPIDHTISVRGTVLDKCDYVDLANESLVPVVCQILSWPGMVFEWSATPDDDNVVVVNVTRECERRNETYQECRSNCFINTAMLKYAETKVTCLATFEDPMYGVSSDRCLILRKKGLPPSKLPPPPPPNACIHLSFTPTRD